MAQDTQRLSAIEKAGYGLGDAAANFIFQTMVMFQLVFYTDTFGITAAAAGTLLVVVRIWDAVFDPIMGVIADHTKTRWGRFRPWVLWTAVPFGIMGFLTFVTPDLGPQGKLIYAYVTYIVLMMVYSANNLPYSALSGVMTGDQGERTSLSSYRFVCAMSAQLVVYGLALPMVNYFGQGNSAKGYQYTIGLFSVLAVLFFFVTFATTRERIQPAPDQKASIGQHFGDLARNGPWLVMFVLTLVLFIALAMHGSVVPYYFNYFVDKGSLSAAAAALGVGAARAADEVKLVSFAFSSFNVLGTLATIVGIFFSKGLAMRFGKRNVFVGGLAGTALLTALFTYLPASAVALMFVAEILRQFVYGFTIPLLWAMMADVADFSEWKNHRRATGMVFSAIVFALKAGLGFGGAITGYVLSLYGYVPNVAQSARALDGILLTMGLYPGVAFAACAACLLFYRINKQAEQQIAAELAARRAQQLA
jgi:GPH family glycoside/pentoside/hexuronide:cation symporter